MRKLMPFLERLRWTPILAVAIVLVSSALARAQFPAYGGGGMAVGYPGWGYGGFYGYPAMGYGGMGTARRNGLWLWRDGLRLSRDGRRYLWGLRWLPRVWLRLSWIPLLRVRLR